MRRLIKVIAAALMVVLMATTVSPAFAATCTKVNWWKCEGEVYGQEKPKGEHWWKTPDDDPPHGWPQ